MRKTPLRAWVDADETRSVCRLAAAAGITRGRLYHYLKGTAIPQGPVMLRLIRLTGLTAEDLIAPVLHRRDRVARQKVA